MSVREDFLKRQLTRLLDRRTMPRGFEGKPQAQAEELAALVRCLCKFAPRQAYDEWWPRVEDTIDEDAKTRAWPTVFDISAAARKVAGSSTKTVAEPDEKDPLAIIGARMERGETVGDHYLWGRLAVDLLRGGYVTQDTISKYRSALFFQCKDLYGQDTAEAMEREFRSRHASAEVVNERVRISVNAAIPNKRPVK